MLNWFPGIFIIEEENNELKAFIPAAQKQFEFYGSEN